MDPRSSRTMPNDIGIGRALALGSRTNFNTNNHPPEDIAMSKRVKKSKVATPLQAEGTDVSALSNVARPKIIRGRRGGLKDMLDMPTDILLEIFRHFHPRDLLSLARTTKEFRAFLMSRSSSLNIWKASRQHIEGLPDCPEHLSEPAYANLVFFPHCHNCLRGNVKAVLWHLNARYCKDCRSKLLCSQYQAAISIPSSMFRAGFMLLNLNHMTVKRRYDQYYFMTERIKELCDQWTELPDDDVVRTTFIETLRTKENQICDHADLCIAWENKRLDSRAEELMSVRKTRLEAIIEKLRDAGWGDEIDKLPESLQPLSDHAHVRNPKPLTDRAWVKIRQDLIAYMQGIKEERLTVERFEVLSERCRKFASMVLDVYATPRRTAETEYLPLPGDLAMMSSIRDVLEAPNDVDVSTEIIESLSDLLPALTRAWKADIRSRCTQILQEHLPDGDVASLDLAIAFLECVGCHRILRYPAILSHKCLRKVYNHYPSEDNMIPQYEQAVFSSNGHRRPLSTEILRVSSAIDNCQKILRALGKDPMVTTERELDEQNARLCFTKPNRPLVKQLMAWRVAMQQQWSFRRFPEQGEWKMASDKETEDAKALEKAATPDLAAISDFQWCCSRCYVWFWNERSFPQAKAHMLTHHDIADASAENGDIYLHPGHPDRLPRKIFMIPRSFLAQSTELTDEELLARAQGRVIFYDD